MEKPGFFMDIEKSACAHARKNYVWQMGAIGGKSCNMLKISVKRGH